jgi:tripartite-type tricarboxylate transporter receptor subunit TctC
MNVSDLLRAALAFLAASGAALAQDWQPSRPVQLILPFAPGATADAFARPVASRLSEALGQPVVIQNRPGANGVIGTSQVQAAPPDGHTLLVTFSTHYSVPFLQKGVPYDTLKDFTPIIAAASIHTVLAVHPSHPAKTMHEFLAQAKSAPQPVLYGSGGLILFGELLAQSAGIRMQHVAYKGGGPMMTDLLGGQISTGLTVLSSAMPHVKSGKLRVLAVLSDKRSRAAPDIPAVTEAVPAYSMQDTWVGVLGPAGLPEPIVRRVHAEVAKALQSPEIHGALSNAGFEITANQSPQELAGAVQRYVETMRRVTSNAGIVPQ